MLTRAACDRSAAGGRGLSVVGRLGAVLRNLRSLGVRLGVAGAGELILARAFPGRLAYRRVILVASEVRGRPRPDIGVRRIKAHEPALDEFNARLRTIAEPGVPMFSPSGLRGTFSRGAEAWVAEADGSIVHVRIVSFSEFGFADTWMALMPDECATPLAATLPAFRGRGIGQAVLDDASAALRRQGITTMFRAINRFNRRWLVRVLRFEGARRVATVHVLVLGGRRWRRIVPESIRDAEMLEGRGLRTATWVKAPILTTR